MIPLRVETGEAGVRLLPRTPTRPLLPPSTTRARRPCQRSIGRRRRRLPTVYPPLGRLVDVDALCHGRRSVGHVSVGVCVRCDAMRYDTIRFIYSFIYSFITIFIMYMSNKVCTNSDIIFEFKFPPKLEFCAVAGGGGCSNGATRRWRCGGGAADSRALFGRFKPI